MHYESLRCMWCKSRESVRSRNLQMTYCYSTYLRSLSLQFERSGHTNITWQVIQSYTEPPPPPALKLIVRNLTFWKQKAKIRVYIIIKIDPRICQRSQEKMAGMGA